MTLSSNELHSIAQLACLETNPHDMATLTQEINSIIDFVQQLRKTDTTNIAPLFHPFDLHQRLREDSVTEEDCLAELAEIAPLFEEHLYLVPKVIESRKSL